MKLPVTNHGGGWKLFRSFIGLRLLIDDNPAQDESEHFQGIACLAGFNAGDILLLAQDVGNITAQVHDA